MLLLLGFAFLAGIATVLSPCVIPILPVLLSGGIGKGSYRPLGIIIGLMVSFTIFTLLLTSLVHFFGISASYLRYFAIIVIALFGLVMIFPRLGDFFSRQTSKVGDLGASLQETATQDSGFYSGFLLGLALGLVWTPCAGPILAAISTLAATKDISWDAFLITFAYTLGAAIPMYIIASGGKYVLLSSKFLSRHAEGIRRGFGILMLVAALGIATNFDLIFQQWSYQFVPTLTPDDNTQVRKQLAKLRGEEQLEMEQNFDTLRQLPVLGRAPDFKGIDNWINTQPLTLQNLEGKVVLIDFWTYSCINCIRTLPYLRDIYEKYKDKGLVLVGVHTPEFEFEKDPKNVEEAVKKLKVPYPVGQDNQYETWKAYHNLYWPAHYLIDQQGNIRYTHFGEGAYTETENAVRQLLMMQPLSEGKEAPTAHRPVSPETYLGYARADHYSQKTDLKINQTADYQLTLPLSPYEVGLQGKWFVDAQYILSESDQSSLAIDFLATNVYLVLSGTSDQPVSLLLDQEPLSKEFYTKDMDQEGKIYVKEARKYDMINLHGKYGRHTLTLMIPKGIKAYAFTFGDEE